MIDFLFIAAGAVADEYWVTRPKAPHDSSHAPLNEIVGSETAATECLGARFDEEVNSRVCCLNLFFC